MSWIWQRSYRSPALLLPILVTAALLWLRGPAAFDFSTPSSYGGDSFFESMMFKSALEAGWYPWYLPAVGAPFGTALFDFPTADGAHFLLIKLLGLIRPEWVFATKAFYVLGFYLSAFSAFAVLRRLGAGTLWALAGALLFSFLPYHYLRLGHLFLSSYFVVPLGAWLALRAFDGAGSTGGGWRRRLLLAGAILLVGSAGVYYAFFAVFLVALAGAAAWYEKRSVRHAGPALFTLAGIVLVVGLNIAPSLHYFAENGRNPAVANRQHGESEIYGLKLVQMLIPHPRHPVVSADEFNKSYQKGTPLINENFSASPGLVGSAGLLFLLWVAVIARRQVAEPFGRLASLNLGALLLGSVGGLGSLFALAISPQIRAYNRISVYVAFFSIAAAILLVQKFGERLAHRHAAGAAVLAVALTVAGLWEQSVKPAAFNLGEFESDVEFFGALDRMLPAGAAVYQLPYHGFPEAGDLHAMSDYSLMRGYLHSRHLRWSYGAIRGREGDRWQQFLASKGIEAQMRIAAASGFSAVYVERRGFVDRGALLEEQLRRLLGKPVLESRDRHLVVFALQPTGNRPPSIDELMDDFSIPMEFSKPFPDYVEKVSGMHKAERWGAWSGEPVVRITLGRSLPEAFTLNLDVADALGENRTLPGKVVVGGSERSVVFGSNTRHSIAFDNVAPGQNSIEIVIPRPASPRALGISADPREIGVGFKSLSIVRATDPNNTPPASGKTGSQQ